MFTCQLDEHLALRMLSPWDVEESSAVVRRNLDRLARWMPWATPDGASASQARPAAGRVTPDRVGA